MNFPHGTPKVFPRAWKPQPLLDQAPLSAVAVCSLHCRSPALLAGQDNAAWEGSKTQSLFVIQILYEPHCGWRSVVPFILWSGHISVSSHNEAFSSHRRQGNEMDRAGGMSVTQHKAIAVRKHKGPTSAEQIHGSPLLLAALSSAG